MKNRKRNRIKGFDYSKDNLYFVTSCVKNMECCLGKVVSAVGTGCDLFLHESNETKTDHISNNDHEALMILNDFGIIANNQLQWLETQYPYIILHSYIVMPNHIHVVIEIDSLKANPTLTNPANQLNVPKVKIKPLSQIMGAYKTTSSKLIHEAGYDEFQWHRSFHDSIIRNEIAYLTIMNYIKNNPNLWCKDKFYKRY